MESKRVLCSVVGERSTDASRRHNEIEFVAKFFSQQNDDDDDEMCVTDAKSSKNKKKKLIVQKSKYFHWFSLFLCKSDVKN